MELKPGLKKVPKTTNSGVYILEIYLKDELFLNSKKFNLLLHTGYYYYFGSAQKNLISRINRHIKKDKIIHWHIDLLTTNSKCNVSNVYYLLDMGKEIECEMRKKVEEGFHLLHPIKSFGNSDCKNCYSHLLYSKTKISYNHFCSLYHSMVSFIPSHNGISDS